jgi:hypothetical protein
MRLGGLETSRITVLSYGVNTEVIKVITLGQISDILRLMVGVEKASDKVVPETLQLTHGAQRV